jgi:hypothetical protein
MAQGALSHQELTKQDLYPNKDSKTIRLPIVPE